jgi:cell filamentation protein
MKKKTRYQVKDPLVDEKHGILKNKFKITDKEKLQLIETDHLAEAYRKAVSEYGTEHTFTEKDIRHLHKLFLGDIYSWAGKYRAVDISSEDIRYCHAAYIQPEMQKYSKMLETMTPFIQKLPQTQLAYLLAKIHGELIVIHPFRDGNGRTTRLLGDLLLMQGGYKMLRSDAFYEEPFVEKYHDAIRRVWHLTDYSGLTDLFRPLLEKQA